MTSSITYLSSAYLTDLGFLDAYADLNDSALVPAEVIAAPTTNKMIDLEVIFDTMDNETNCAMFNQIMYTSPLVPAMLSALSLGDNATVESAYTSRSFVVDYGDVVDIIIKNEDAGKHPL